MSSKKPQKHSGHKRTKDDSDNEEGFHALPKESSQPQKKKQKGVNGAPVFNIPPPPGQISAAASSSKKSPAPAPSSKPASKPGKPGPPGSKATVPMVGDDDEEMDSGEDEGGDSDAEGTQQKEVKVLTKTEAKAARVWDRPAVSASTLLPDPKARTPSHIAAKTGSSTAAASTQLLAPLEGSAASSVASTVQPAMRKVIVVLVKASLETVKTKKGYELISADTHKHILQKLKKNPSEYRPDILHQCLLTLLDSPLNKAGLLEVFVQTEKNVLIEVHSSIRIPRTFKRFAGLMVQLLHKLKIRSSDSSDMLLKVIRNPVTDHLPIGSLKIGTSVTGDLVDIRELASNVVGANPTAPIVFCVGSHASGPADVNWTDKSIAISKYPLSASVALGRICNAFEGIWNVL